MFGGWFGSAAPENPEDGESQPTGAATETQGEKCRKKLTAAIRRVDPESLSFQANPERAINGLNAWLASCARDELAGIEPGEATLSLVGDNPRTTARRFTANDSTYIRDCLLLKDLTTAIWSRIPAVDDEGSAAGKDVRRVEGLFTWLCRNISILSADFHWLTEY